jgi:hypothetical protein
MKPAPPTHEVDPGNNWLQYCVWMFAHELPPTPEKKELRYACRVLDE